MFYKDGKFYGDDFSFTFPNGCHIWIDFDEPDIRVIEFTKKEPNTLYHIEIDFYKQSEAISLENSLSEKIDALDCEADGQIFSITRGKGTGVAAYYHHAVNNYYEECYKVKDGDKEYLACFAIWTSLLDDPNVKKQLLEIDDEKYIAQHFKKVPVKEVLDRPEVKEFFDSIILTE